MKLDISGMGLILYSPPAVRHIPEGTDYLSDHFNDPSDVARHVMDCQLTAFCTGTPGSFRLRFSDGGLDASALESAAFKIRLGLQVNEGVIFVRDLFDLMDWTADRPASQQIAVADGWYRLTVYTSPPQSGILGDNQTIDIHLESVAERPALRWHGVPNLC